MNDRNLDNTTEANNYPIPEETGVTSKEEFAHTEAFPARDRRNPDAMGAAAGVETSDFETLRVEEKLEERDENRWELDPDSAEDR